MIGTAWWNERLADKQMHQQVRVFDHGGRQMLTRGDLFALGQLAVATDASDEDVLTLLWNVLAWGTGASQRGNAVRLRSLEGNEARGRIDLLREAIGHVASGDSTTAYRTLIRPGGGRIPGLGPAFFTKVLYFASEGTTGRRSLILDARVAGNLARAGWSSLPVGRSGYSYNWYTDTYSSYCELLARWADEASKRQGKHIAPDEIERALFADTAAPRHP